MVVQEGERNVPLPWLESPWQTLVDAIDKDRVAHALLIRGVAGTGKRALQWITHDGFCARPLYLEGLVGAAPLVTSSMQEPIRIS